MGKPKAPEAPDYAAAATAQGEANLNSALASNFLNQVSQVGPTGSLTYTNDPSRSYTLPDGTVIPGTIATTTLSPEQQRLYDQNVALSTSLNDLAAQGIGYVGDAVSTPLDTSNLPALVGSVGNTSTGIQSQVPGTGYQTSVPTTTLQSSVPTAALQSSIPTTNVQSSVPTTNVQSSVDFSNASAAPTLDSFTGQRDQITDAMMARLQPYIDRDREALRTQLNNQGIGQGTEAYGWDMDQFQRGVNDQRIAALLAGDTEQQNLFNNAMSLRNQGTSEALAAGNFANNAAAQEFSQNLSAGNFANNAADQSFNQGLAAGNFANSAANQEFNQSLSAGNFANTAANQEFNQSLAAGNFSNAVSDAMFNQQMAQAGFNNTAQQQEYNQMLNSASLSNSARTQGLQEAEFLRTEPLNILNALRTGNQASIPTFGNVGTGVGITPAPIYSATQDAYNSALQNYNIQAQQYGGLLGGLASLGGAAIMASDRRLKKNIQLLGIRQDGLGIYSYEYLWADKPSIGVMADEVALMRPEALGPSIAGYATVNYGAL